MAVHVRRIGELQPREVEAIAAFVSSSPLGHFYQHPFLPRIDAARPGESYCLWTEDATGIGASGIVRVYRAGRFGPLVARADRGPVAGSPEALELLLRETERLVRKIGVVAFRANPYIPEGSAPSLDEVFVRRKFRFVADGDYEKTLEVDLTQDPTALLGAFRKTTRSEIRKAQKAGIRCVVANATQQAEIFAAHYDAMVKRKGATPRPRELFLALSSHLVEHPERGFHLVSYHEDRVLAGVFVLRHGDRAIYAFGATGDEPDRLPKAHLLQWEAMLRAREMGCSRYDLGGFSAGTGQDGQRSATQSVNVFKSGFTRNETRFSGCREIVIRPWPHRTLRIMRRFKSAAAKKRYRRT